MGEQEQLGHNTGHHMVVLPRPDQGFDFHLGETADMIRTSVREFTRQEIAPRASLIDRTDEFPMDLWSKMGNLGLLGMTVPEEDGGTV